MSIAVCTRSLAVAITLTFAFAAPSAFAQADADQPSAGAAKPKPAKKPKKKKPAAADTAPAAADEAKPMSAGQPAPPGQPAKEDAKPAEGEAKPDAEGKKIEEGMPSDSGDEMTNTYEDPNKRYYFLGLRYRGTIIPQFIENLFVDEGRTVYSNSFGAELDMRKGGQSMIPWIVYADYSMGDTLFHQKGGTPTGQAGDAGNFTVVNSSLKALYLGLDELWSIPLDKSHHWDFEFGFGVGVGVVFGTLQNDWVFQNNSGPLVSADGTHYSECQQFSTDVACTIMGHTGATTRKVGGYSEPNWFQGGALPVFFPHISFPQLGIRYKPIKKMEARLGVGFSLTGFWIGLSADYGLEETEPKTPVKPATAPKESGVLRLRDML